MSMNTFLIKKGKTLCQHYWYSVSDMIVALTDLFRQVACYLNTLTNNFL